MSRLKYLWTGLCLCFITAFLFPENYIAFHWDHDCYGADCPACLMIQGAEHFLRQFRGAAFYPAFSGRAFLAAAFILKFAVLSLIPLSSVRLKIKMNR
jgi:hypothetical protein